MTLAIQPYQMLLGQIPAGASPGGTMNAAAQVIAGLEPMAAHAALVEVLERAKKVCGLGPSCNSFTTQVDALGSTILEGGPTGMVCGIRRGAAQALHLFAGEGEKILGAAGWRESAEQFFSGRSKTERLLHRVMNQVDASAGTFLEMLDYMVSLQGVSDAATLPNPNVRFKAEWVSNKMEDAGLERVRLLEVKGGNPSVYGELGNDPSKPTVWIYGHFDVQPTGAREHWNTDPFQTVYKNGRIYGRGTADDGVAFVAALAVVEAFRKAGVEIPVNLGFFFEGEEEISSPNLGPILRKLKGSVLPPDVVFLADGKNVLTGVPTLSMGARGIVEMRVILQTNNQDIHGGLSAGAHNALNVLNKVVGTLLDGRMDLVIPGLTDVVPPLPPRIRKSLPNSARLRRVLRKAWGMRTWRFVGTFRIPLLERIGGGYHLQVLAEGGTQSLAGPAGVVVSRGERVLQFRIPPGVDIKTARRKIELRIRELARQYAGGATLELKIGRTISPWLGRLDHPDLALMKSAMRYGFGRRSVFESCGGGIGFLSAFERMFPKALLVPIGVEDPYSNAHGPNESQDAGDFVKTARSLAAFLLLKGSSGDSLSK